MSSFALCVALFLIHLDVQHTLLTCIPVGEAGLDANSPTMRLVLLGYMVPVAENNSDQTQKPANEGKKYLG